MPQKTIKKEEMKMNNYSIKTLFYLLYARYGGSHIKSNNPAQWKYKIFSNIFTKGPAWKKHGELQQELIDSTTDDLQKGQVQINNMAANPDGTPINPDGSSSKSWEAIGGINSQNTYLQKSGKLNTLANADGLITNDFTSSFINSFQKFFISVASPSRPLWYPEIGYDVDEELETFDNYKTNSFEEIWPTYEDFYADYTSCGIPTTI